MKSIGKGFVFFSFWKVHLKLMLYLLLKFGKIWKWSHVGMEIYCEKCLIVNSVSLIDIKLLNYSTFSWISFGSLWFSTNFTIPCYGLLMTVWFIETSPFSTASSAILCFSLFLNQFCQRTMIILVILRGQISFYWYFLFYICSLFY